MPLPCAGEGFISLDFFVFAGFICLNFGKFDYVDKEDNSEVRHVGICPMYAIAQIEKLKQELLQKRT